MLIHSMELYMCAQNVVWRNLVKYVASLVSVSLHSVVTVKYTFCLVSDISVQCSLLPQQREAQFLITH